ncbi:amino acid ABC transporter permease [Pikeienuella piscinae]|uniref:Amino acid ABC transporter permease n=1 Tax=Pikeienuella piscinae TaxID=2748098 RepID=A0A7L5C235_9RHOB|nr:amino acid ABC transporter permease [Pikeienuella piscinae]QIE55929.1 amino acid ABC transporter permease [Pikeienuella piscinae]
MIAALDRWLRPLYATPGAAATNLAGLALLMLIVPPVLDWAIFSAVWSAEDMNGCPPEGGACWAFIRAKARLILFGRYVYVEQWRPVIATLILAALVAFSLNPRFWRPALAGAWVVGLILYSVLMWGGVLGLRYIDSSYWGGLPLTVLLTIFGTFFGIFLAIPIALARYSKLPAFRYVATVYVELVRGVPLISVLFMASVLIPVILPQGFAPSGLVRVLFGLTVFIAAYMAEVLRGGLQAIPSGQFEASRALGLSYFAMMVRVVLPQVFEIVLPPTVSLIIACLKGTSLVVIVAMLDLLGAAKAALADPKWIGFHVEAFVFAALIYAIMCGAISAYGRRIEGRLAQTRAK